MLELLLRDAFTGVLDADQSHSLGMPPSAHGYQPTLGCMADGIADQIGEHLCNALSVGQHYLQIRIDLSHQAHAALGTRCRLDTAHHLVDHVAERKRPERQRQRAIV